MNVVKYTICPFVAGIMVLHAVLLGATVSHGAQIVRVPYAVTKTASGWWSGIAITNLSLNTIAPIVIITNSDGSDRCIELADMAAGEIYASFLENIIPTMQLDARVSVKVVNNSEDLFGVTVFTGQDDGGFAFQEFLSANFPGSYICLPVEEPITR